MATSYTSNKKIGALDAASTPLAATNEVVINQNGDILKTPLSAVEAKIFDAKTASSSPTGTEVVVVRQTDNTLRQVALADIVPALNITNAKVSASAAIVDTKLDTINTAGKVTNNAVQAVSTNTANRIVTRDGSGNFAAGTVTASLSGNASTATTLQTGRTVAISGDVTGTATSFNGSANITIPAVITAGVIVDADVNASAAIALSKLATGALPTGITVASANLVDGTIVNADINASAAIVDTKLATIATAGKVANTATTATNANSASAIVARDASGNFSAGTITAALTGNVTGNASTATTLATGRTIALTGDVTYTSPSFNGSANVTAAATIANNAVTTAKIADANVTTAKIADGNVTLAKLIAAVQEALVPIGGIVPFGRTTAPAGWLACDGQPVNRIGTYAALFAAIGTTWGVGNGSTTFNVPDLQDRYLRHAGATFSGAIGTTQSDEVKSHAHTASTNSTGAHTHTVSGTAASDGAHTHTASTNSTGAHTHTFKAQSLASAAGGGYALANNNDNFGSNLTGLNNAINSAGNHSHTVTVNSGGAHTHSVSGTAASAADHSHTVTVNSTGGTENRPYSATVLYCIKF